MGGKTHQLQSDDHHNFLQIKKNLQILVIHWARRGWWFGLQLISMFVVQHCLTQQTLAASKAVVTDMPELYEGRSGRPRETTIGEKNDKPNSMDVQIEVLRIRSPSIVLWKFPWHFAALLPWTPYIYLHVCLYVYFFFGHVYQFLPTFSSIFNPKNSPLLVTPLIKQKNIPRNHPRSCMRQLLDFYNFATDHTASRPDFWSCFRQMKTDGPKTHGDEKLCRQLCIKKYLFFLGGSDFEWMI